MGEIIVFLSIVSNLPRMFSAICTDFKFNCRWDLHVGNTTCGLNTGNFCWIICVSQRHGDKGNLEFLYRLFYYFLVDLGKSDKHYINWMVSKFLNRVFHVRIQGDLNFQVYPIQFSHIMMLSRSDYLSRSLSKSYYSVQALACSISSTSGDETSTLASSKIVHRFDRASQEHFDTPP